MSGERQRGFPSFLADVPPAKYGHGYLGKSVAIQWVCIQTTSGTDFDREFCECQGRGVTVEDHEQLKKSIQDSQQRTVLKQM
jgi:hypothetical protein